MGSLNSLFVKLSIKFWRRLGSQDSSDVPLGGMVDLALAKPTISIEERSSAISSCPFFSVVRLSVFALCLYPFFRLYLPWYPSFLCEMDVLSVDGSLSHIDPVIEFVFVLRGSA